MDYKKEYNDICQKLMSAYNTTSFIEVRKVIEKIHPELRESEDERIRKELIDALKASETVGELKFILPEPTREECVAYLEKQKEQKHPDGCFTCNEYKKGYEEGRRNGFTAGYNKAIKEVEQKEQKPAEWSEDDKIRLKVINEELQRFVRTNPYGTPLSVDDFAWLESLPERFSLQPKQEWPVEGEFPYNTPADTIEGEIENIWNKLSCENRFTATKEGFREVLLHFVNYVRSNAASGWSEEDEEIFNNIIEKAKGGHWIEVNEITWLITHFKSLRPQPHTVSIKDAIKFGNLEYERGVKDGIQHSENHRWKPSDEQMDSLRDTIIQTKGYSYSMYLPELYEQLKQLK